MTLEHVTERSNSNNLVRVIVKATKDKDSIEQGSLAQKLMNLGIGE
jgi:hypothetical protein